MHLQNEISYDKNIIYVQLTTDQFLIGPAHENLIFLSDLANNQFKVKIINNIALLHMTAIQFL